MPTEQGISTVNDRNRFLERVRTAYLESEPFAPDPEACPSADELWNAAHEQLDGERIAELTDHASACSSCAQLWAAALRTDFGQPPSKVVQIRPKADRPANRFRQWRLAASLTMMLLGAGMFVPALIQAPAEEVPTVRSADNGSTEHEEPEFAWLTIAGLILFFAGGAFLLPTLLARSD